MACSCGACHTTTLSDDGEVYSFGRNDQGQLGLGHNNKVSRPTAIPNLPKIKQISCGEFFTVCVDNEGFLWSFGYNSGGQLGTGNTNNINVPHKIEDIPPVSTVSCGCNHILIITNQSHLWSCGNNAFGQLCIEQMDNQLIQTKPLDTKFRSISKISAGNLFSYFQSKEGRIYSCGYNCNGELGLGHYTHQKTVALIKNQPPNIIQFTSGYNHCLFLDKNGNVFSVGGNGNGQLGLGHNNNQNVLVQIPNIPPIQTISCLGSSYLLDFEGNVWSFGINGFLQLGHGNKVHIHGINVPKKIDDLKDIQQMACGYSSNHFLAKDYQNKIFAMGNNDYGQTVPENTEPVSTPTELSSEYSSIWGNLVNANSKAKSARK